MRDEDAGNFWCKPVLTEDKLGDFALDNPSEFRRLADGLPAPCWIAMPDGYIVWYNRRWYDYCGRSPADMEGWGWQSIHDPEVLPEVMETWEQSIRTGEPFEMVFPLRGFDGEFRPFLTRIVPLRRPDGEIERWLGINIEIGRQMRAETALLESEASMRVLTDAMPQMVWSTRPDGYHDYYNARWYEFTGVPAGSTDGEGWSGMFHADDQDEAWARWRHSLATGEPYEVEYRLRRHDGEYRWTLGRALPVRNGRGEIVRWIGTCTEIHDAKTVAEQNEVLSRELSHRIKNIFAVVAGLIQLTGRGLDKESRRQFADLSERVLALGRAHNYARPHSDRSRPNLPGGQLSGLLAELTRPYQSRDGQRISISTDSILLDDKGATPLALVFHELATNSAKYGALSREEGRVVIEARSADDEVTIEWRESDGPPIEAEPTMAGFGSKLLGLSIEQQLGGTLHREWNREGLTITLTVPAGHLHRGARPN